MSIVDTVHDIFFVPDSKRFFDPKDLGKHYMSDLPSCSMDAVYVASGKYRELESILDRYKFHSHREYTHFFVDLLSDVVDLYDLKSEPSCVLVPIPMHPFRYISRGYDPVKRMTKYLSKRTGIRMDLFLKHRLFVSYRHQSHLSRQDRLDNKIRSFSVRRSTIVPDTVILVDDVVSTGATANICARLLKQKGVKRIIFLGIVSNSHLI